MRGSVRKWRNGWQYRLRGPDGREISRAGFARRADAQEALNKVLVTISEGRYVAPDRLTVAQYLENVWLPAVESGLAPSTFANYELIVKSRISTRIGDIPLQKLTEAHLLRLYADLGVDGHHASTDKNPRGLAPKSIRHVHTLLHRALADAAEWRYISRNVAAGKKVRPPRVTQNLGLNTWSAAQLQAFLEGIAEERLFPLWRFLAMTGARRGEALALTWANTDLRNAVVIIDRARTVYGTSSTKTDRSRRSIDLDPQTVAILKAWRKRQLEERMLWGEFWTDSGLVFTREDGKGYHPDGITGIFERLQREHNERATGEAPTIDKQPAPLPRIRLHDLRHTHATLLLAGGEHPKVVSERLGHASVAFTLTTYAHVLPGLQREAVGRLAALIDG